MSHTARPRGGPAPRLFVLRRDRDITGVSGVGDVADGVQWPDGTVVLRWRERPSTAMWDSLDVMLSVHGHDGATRVVWADGAESRAQAAAGRAYRLADQWEAAHSSTTFLVRAAGAERRDLLDDSAAAAGNVVRPGQKPQAANGNGVDESGLPVTAECSAQHLGHDEHPRQCIRAAQHRGDHIDEHGFAWSDTVAVYPVGASAEHQAHPGFTCVEVDATRPDWNVRWSRMAPALPRGRVPSGFAGRGRDLPGHGGGEG
ncbi:hypothetical protein [Streptomyces sp. NPDC058424]|uniref:hypothetical protein n=1 Tax=Streptomyces sp. NPDC058424 TaxID=3346491 RepID=UPI0036663263